GGETTVSLAVPAPPEPPSLEVAVTGLFLVPAVLPVTLTTTVPLSPAVSVAPDRLTLVAPPVAVMVPFPAQVPVTPGVEAPPRPEGRVSVKPIPVRAIVLVPGLVTVKVRVVDPLSAIVLAPKASAIVGGVATDRVAVLEVVPVPPLVEDTAPVVLL